MSDTLPTPLVAAGFAAPAPLPSPGRVLQIEFTGSGSEYFRIWIVNLLLTLVTVGFYYPWAKVRRLRYFYGNTVVGEHALDFHGDPKRMLRGFLLVGLMLLLYSVAGKVSPTAGLIAFVIIAVVWPALFRASLRFRLANTSWRGLRFRFTGDMAGAYRAILPIFLPGALVIGATLLGDPEAAVEARRAAGFAVLGASGAAMLLLPWVLWLLKRYQHGNYALGNIRTELRTGAGPFYLIALKTFGMAMLMGLVAGLIVGVLGAAGASVFNGLGQGGKFAAILIGALLGYGVLLLIIVPYSTARMQNLVWGRTESTEIRFESALGFGALLAMTLKNWLLMLVTLGFYWPFARVAMARLRLSAVTVITSGDPDLIISALHQRGDDATGDAAGDLFGIDIGL